jgi:hypothetical protein
MCQKAASNQSDTSLLLHLLVLLSGFARLCCFEEKSNQFSLMRKRPYFVPREPSSFCANTTFIVSKQEHRKMNYLKIPFTEEDFGISCRTEDSLGHFRGRSRRAASASDANQSESNKFSTHFGARVAPLPPAKAEDAFWPVGLSTEDFAANFVLRFKGLARASS